MILDVIQLDVVDPRGEVAHLEGALELAVAGDLPTAARRLENDEEFRLGQIRHLRRRLEEDGEKGRLDRLDLRSDRHQTVGHFFLF